jgi:hypothetical protein
VPAISAGAGKSSECVRGCCTGLRPGPRIARCVVVRDTEIATGAAFTMPTTNRVKRTARPVRYRPTSARRRERPVFVLSLRASCTPAGFVESRHLRLTVSSSTYSPWMPIAVAVLRECAATHATAEYRMFCSKLLTRQVSMGGTNCSAAVNAPRTD